MAEKELNDIEKFVFSQMTKYQINTIDKFNEGILSLSTNIRQQQINKLAERVYELERKLSKS